MGKSFLANIPPPTCEKSGLELCLAQDAGPLGNLVARQTDRQRASLSGKGKALPQQGNLKIENLEAAWAPGKEVVSRSYQLCFSLYLDLI